MHCKFSVSALALFVFLLNISGCFFEKPTISSNETNIENHNTTGTTNKTSTPSESEHTDSNSGSIMDYVNKNKGMLKRGMYVFIAVTVIILFYFGFRVYKARRRRVKSYGLLSSNDRHMELSRLNSDSEDDYTVFEARPLN